MTASYPKNKRVILSSEGLTVREGEESHDYEMLSSSNKSRANEMENSRLRQCRVSLLLFGILPKK